MTEKQKRFADEYIIDLNGTRAYKAAYPSVKSDHTATVNAGRLLTNADIKSYVDKRIAEIRSKKTAEATEVMEYLTSVMRGESTADVVVVDGDGAKIINKNPDEKERLKAAELLGKRFGLFRENVEIGGKMGVTIVDDIK